MRSGRTRREDTGGRRALLARAGAASAPGPGDDGGLLERLVAGEPALLGRAAAAA